MGMKGGIKSGIRLVPDTASPVLKSRITIELDNDFPFTMNRDDFSVNCTDVNDANNTRYMNVISVDDSTKSMVVLFGGAYSGNYTVKIRHNQFGLLATNGLILKVGAWVTGISPRTASVYGGAILTIDGINFGNETTDNPVQISYNGGVGSTNCYVKETGPTQIKCRIDDTIGEFENGKSGDVVVFLKASEEATISEDLAAFSFTNVVAKVNLAEAIYDSTNHKWTYVLTGEGFTGDASSVELYIAGVKQTTSAVSSTEVTFTIDNVSSEDLSTAKIYFPEGIPELVADISGLSLTPKFVSLSHQEGSVGSSIITANVPGIGVNTKSVDFKLNGTSICQSVKITAYGVAECHTLASEIASGEVQLIVGSNTYNCSNSDPNKCHYQQAAAGAFPAISAISKTEQTVVITGTNFFTTGYFANVTIENIKADSVVIDSET